MIKMNEKIKKRIIETAAGRRRAQLVLKNAKYLNVFLNCFNTADIAVTDGYFAGIGEYEGEQEIDCGGLAVVPGFIDGHIHLESSVVSPLSFAAAVSPHGTTAVVTDPHEITNVLGRAGMDYMLSATENLPVDVFFCVPSCVPASPFDENGAHITSREVAEYIKNERVVGLAEMMNFPATIAADGEIIKMIATAENAGRAVDGHAPGLSGKALNAYISAGIGSDHECTTLDEALEKLSLGQYIMIRQGTAGRNLKALLPLLKGEAASRCLFATDDKHPNELLENGHMDYIIREAISAGVRAETAYKAASFNAAEYFALKGRGAVAPGYIADFVLLEDIDKVKIRGVYKNGAPIDLNSCNKDAGAATPGPEILNSVNAEKITAESIRLRRQSEKVIGVVGGEIVTTDEGESDKIDVDRDILKLCVVERHKRTGHIGVCFVKGYGLKSGAVATSVAHDSHNIIAVGASDEEIAAAVNEIIEMQGGMGVVKDGKALESLKLNIAGLMTDEPVQAVADKITKLKAAAYSLGVNKNIDPFMTLSFISLPVIPKLKLTTLGVVDVEKFELV